VALVSDSSRIFRYNLKYSAQDARDVRIDDTDRLAAPKACDRSSGVSTKPGNVPKQQAPIIE